MNKCLKKFDYDGILTGMIRLETQAIFLFIDYFQFVNVFCSIDWKTLLILKNVESPRVIHRGN